MLLIRKNCLNLHRNQSLIKKNGKELFVSECDGNRNGYLKQDRVSTKDSYVERRNAQEDRSQNNHAGDTHFVDCTLVRGTLRRGFEYYQALEDPFARSIFMLFMISEIHPFNDGNGRISRIMMNAELVAADQSKIIIPTVFREDYLNALRRLTRKGDPSVIIRAMSRVRQFSANLVGDNFETTRQYLERCNAFKDGEGYILRF